MVFTMDSNLLIEDANYTVRLTLRDYMGETARKVTKLNNSGGLATNIQSAYRVLESVSNAGMAKAGASLNVGVTGQNTVATSAGQHFAHAKNVMLLGFSRLHPDYSSKTIKATFAIIAPVDAIVNQVTNIGKPIYVRGITFAAAAGVTEALGALIDWLENALVFTNPNGVVTVGGWTYSDALSGEYSVPGIIDGAALT